MSKSPLKFGGIFGSIGATLAGGVNGATNLAAILGRNRRGKGMRGRVKKLENQMSTLMRDRNRNAASEALDRGEGVLGAPDIGAPDIGDISQQPGAKQQLTPLVGDQAMKDGMTGNPSFNLGKGQEMFGNSIPDSFDRDMGV
tara:strand:- start:2038 stop:2463 length:426 start_codon:yes stop_codon:yes gene_type:complete